MRHHAHGETEEKGLLHGEGGALARSDTFGIEASIQVDPEPLVELAPPTTHPPQTGAPLWAWALLATAVSTPCKLPKAGSLHPSTRVFWGAAGK
jgi:hypothetical protein